MSAIAVEVLCCPLAAVSADLLVRYRALLSDDELQRLNNYRSVDAANEFLIARALLRTALGERLNCAPQQLRFDRDADGKPFLNEPGDTAWRFNVSHSRDWVVLALSTVGDVGIDVESHERHNHLTAIARRFFSEREQRSFDGLDGERWRQQFFAIWTLKEAHAKALGCGLAKILGCSSMVVDVSRQAIAMQLSGVAKPTANISSWLFALDRSYSLAMVLLSDTAGVPSLSRTIPLLSTTALPATLLACGY